MTIAEGLKNSRALANYSVKDIEERTGIIKQTYSRYETAVNSPSAEFIAKLARAFDISADCLLGLKENYVPLYSKADASEAISQAEKSASSQENLSAENDSDKLRNLQAQIDALQIQIDALRAALKTQGLKV